MKATRSASCCGDQAGVRRRHHAVRVPLLHVRAGVRDRLLGELVERLARSFAYWSSLSRSGPTAPDELAGREAVASAAALRAKTALPAVASPSPAPSAVAASVPITVCAVGDTVVPPPHPPASSVTARASRCKRGRAAHGGESTQAPRLPGPPRDERRAAERAEARARPCGVSLTSSETTIPTRNASTAASPRLQQTEGDQHAAEDEADDDRVPGRGGAGPRHVEAVPPVAEQRARARAAPLSSRGRPPCERGRGPTSAAAASTASPAAAAIRAAVSAFAVAGGRASRTRPRRRRCRRRPRPRGSSRARREQRRHGQQPRAPGRRRAPARAAASRPCWSPRRSGRRRPGAARSTDSEFVSGHTRARRGTPRGTRRPRTRRHGAARAGRGPWPRRARSAPRPRS